MLRRNSGKLGAPNGSAQGTGPPGRPGTLRGLPNMVRRTLGETDLKSLRASFSMSMTGLLRRGQGQNVRGGIRICSGFLTWLHVSSAGC
jgi:hypothetical protein